MGETPGDVSVGVASRGSGGLQSILGYRPPEASKSECNGERGTGDTSSIPSTSSSSSTTTSSTVDISHWSSFPKDLLAGAILGGISHTIVAPVERAKLLLQTQNSNLRLLQGGKGKYSGMVDCIARVTREEGFLSLWRGNGSGVLRYYPSLAFNFAFKDLYRALFVPKYDTSKDNFWQFCIGNLVSGAAAGSTSLLFLYPLDIAHTRLAADIFNSGKREFNGLSHFLATVYKRDGIRGLYRGFPASIHGIIIHRAVYFGGFDTMKGLLLPIEKDGSKNDVPFWQKWAVAQAVTTVAGFVAYPFDTVRHRMMMQPLGSEMAYRSTMDCWKRIGREEGFSAFFKGSVSNMVRGTGAALILVLYDELKHFMHNQTVPAVSRSNKQPVVELKAS